MKDKLAIGFMAEILHIKGIIGSEELEDILDASHASDLDVVIEKMLTEQYSNSKRGEAYVGYGK